MGILPRHLNILAMEQNNYPIHGEVLTLGQQAVYATYDEVIKIYNNNNVKVNDLPNNFNTKNKIPAWENTSQEKNTNAQTILTLLGADHVYASDVSSYENPDFIIDLNNPIREEYRERFDIIIDVGTLEHVYDVPIALENIIKMLKIDGIVILILPSSGAIDHGFYSFSPTLFFDYFECNGFETLNCYLMRCNSRNYTQKKPVYRYCGFSREYPLKTDDCVEVFYSAKKREHITIVKKPIQSIYTKSIYVNYDRNKQSTKRSIISQVLTKLHRKGMIPHYIYDIAYNMKHNNNLLYVGKY